LRKIALIFILSLVFYSCEKEDFITSQTSSSIISPAPYLITFKNDNIYNMRLDVNSCGSTYKIDDENLIDIEPIYCTEICCDKPFADTLRNVLIIVKSYKITGEDLELIAPNRIINLTKINDD
jgi:hypothetical protein